MNPHGVTCKQGCGCRRHSRATRARLREVALGGEHGRTHGLWKDEHKTYKSWRAMLNRKHIEHDPRWEDPHAFLADMGPRPDGCVLHRTDTDLGYSKDNCEWLDRSEHAKIMASLPGAYGR